MKIDVSRYPNLGAVSKLLARPYYSNALAKDSVVEILEAVKRNGDKAIKDFTLQFDKIVIDDFRVNLNELAAVEVLVENDLKAAIALAYNNISKFHTAQKQSDLEVETMPGVICKRKSVAIERVGLYIPGGTAPLFSTLLMLAVPAIIAGCKELVVCTPSNKSGEIDKNIAYIAHLLGITEVYKIGGAQAIAAMAYGTKTLKKVDKIFGPGNQYVTAAKQMIQSEGIAIDMPAGPSEVLVIADKYANPEFIAADLLSQAEHGADSQVVLLSDDEAMFKKVNLELIEQLNVLKRKYIASAALLNTKFVLTHNIEEAIDISNIYAPEHLILNIKNAELYLDKITNAGSVFIGAYSPESVGDYASGTNHTLPTNGYANAYSGVSLDSFVKKITFQKLSDVGIRNIGNAVITMAQAEGLDAHAHAVQVRLNSR
jgi:histidinol dehydrogenase